MCHFFLHFLKKEKYDILHHPLFAREDIFERMGGGGVICICHVFQVHETSRYFYVIGIVCIPLEMPKYDPTILKDL